jgi:phosphoglycolate phosphatase-like HAD superfamily hydrolase
MPHSHAVIFDIDGVLLHLTRQEEQKFFDAFRAVAGLAEHHIDPDWNSYRVRNDVAIASELLERHFGRVPDETEVWSVLDHYTATVEDGLAAGELVIEVIDGAELLLDALARSGRLHLGLATANIRGVAVARLHHAGLWGPFTACGYAESGGPKIEILRSAVADLRDAEGNAVPPERIVFLGDQLGDLAAARENGVHFIGVSTQAAQREVLRDNGAKLVVANHDDTGEIITSLLDL